MREDIERSDEDQLNYHSWRPHMCQFFREAVLRVSRVELGRIIDADPKTISSWEKPKDGRAPGRKYLDRLCRAFDCEAYELYSEFDPEYTQQFINDIFKTWSFVLQQYIRSNLISEQKFALQLTQLFMDYDERRRIWKSQEPKTEESAEIAAELQSIMFDKNEEEPEIEEGDEVDARQGMVGE